jgi:L-ribulose-5-phosphate 4-epimerase
MDFLRLQAEVLEANLELVRRGLVLYTFGNASGIDREAGIIAIKPSGVPYERMTAADIVLCDLDGKIIEGRLKPSSDLDTHLELYRAFPAIGGVVHTHSEFATSWAQAGRSIPAFGTTHADSFHGPVPVTEELSDEEIQGQYELNTGKAIVRRFSALDPMAMPAVLVAGHAPFTWGKTPMDAAHNAVILESVARMAVYTTLLRPESAGVSQALLDRHYFRKHGADATYGQK